LIDHPNILVGRGWAEATRLSEDATASWQGIPGLGTFVPEFISFDHGTSASVVVIVTSENVSRWIEMFCIFSKTAIT
jgi:hypothetical protein